MKTHKIIINVNVSDKIRHTHAWRVWSRVNGCAFIMLAYAHNEKCHAI